MQMPLPKRIMQIGYISPDPRADARRWHALFGAGPFFYFEEFRFEGWTYRGQAQDVPLDIAMGTCGDLNIEFIRPRASYPTVHGDGTPPQALTLHHLAMLSDDWDRDADAFADMPLLADARTAAGSRLCYRDATAALGALLEIIEAREDVVALLDAIHQASVGWDGKETFASL
jgi:hypothetical protein